LLGGRGTHPVRRFHQIRDRGNGACAATVLKLEREQAGGLVAAGNGISPIRKPSAAIGRKEKENTCGQVHISL
jgi:hypothetical protein